MISYSGELKMETNPESKDRYFCIELKSKTSLKKITITNSSQENALIEGTIGELQKIEFVEGIILEITGSKGLLTVDISQNELESLTRKQRKK